MVSNQGNINSTKVNAIYIDNANGITAVGSKWDIKLLHTNNATAMQSRLEMYAGAQLVMLMKELDNSKETIRLSMGKIRAGRVA